MWATRMLVVVVSAMGIALFGVGCGGEAPGDFRGVRVEGTEPGDCEDGADNDADALFDCADPSCAASPLCQSGGTGGTSGWGGSGGAGGNAGAGGVGGSTLCADVDCDDQNECTTESCDPADGECDYTNVTGGMACDFNGLPGLCVAGVCEDAMLCAVVVCDDDNDCTEDTCDPTNGECGFVNVTDDTACDFGGYPGICDAGACEDAMLCSGVVCDDGNECTTGDCDPMDGECDYAPVVDGMTCDFGGYPGICGADVCEDAMLCSGVVCDDGNECTTDDCDPMDGECDYAPVPDGAACGTGGSAGLCSNGTCSSGAACVTNALCHTCPEQFLCDTDNDCAFSGYVCIPSGCETDGGAPIKQCQPSRGGSCTDDTDCPNVSDYDCITVGAGGNRCVRVAEGCSPATESYDCVPGFSCEGGACVDRRVPCVDYRDCPKSHVCSFTPTASFCVRIHRTCHQDADCAGFAPHCADVDNDGRKECTGELGSSGNACVNTMCSGSAPVCENGVFGTGAVAVCGDYGLCLSDNDCDTGFSCVGLWQDGRKECVPTGGVCSNVTDCLVNQVCASARAGGPPSCQAGYVP